MSFFIALAFIPIGALCIDTLLPYFFSQAIGGLASRNEAGIWTALLLAAAVGVVGSLLNLIGFQALIRHEGNVRKKLMNNTFTRLIQKDMRFFVNAKVGGLTSKFIDFVRSEMTLQDLLIIRTLGFVLSVGAGLTIVALQSWPLAVIIIFLITVLIIQVRWSINKRAPWRHERKELVGDIHGTIADAMTNNLVVKTFAGEGREISALAQKTKRLQFIWLKDIGFVAMESSIRLGFMVIMQIIAIGLCTFLVLNGQMAVEMAIFALTYLQRIASQIFVLGDILNGYDQALLEAAPMSDILVQDLAVTDKPDAISLRNITPTITLRDVDYRYNDADEDVLKTINLSIKAGEKIGLVGPSGAGKSTITHLLLRFSDVTGGAILIDKTDIRDVSQKSLRETIAYVPQEPMLFHRSLRENIAYGRPDATDEDVRRAAKSAHALEFIDKLPEGLDTLVGERGVKLSGGQRQRIAIARAILKDAPILLLDEATSALDSESEKLIQEALKKLMEGRTSIVIAHRLSTIASLDRIIVLENGAIREQGSHKDLLKKDGTYAKLWTHQSGGFIEE